MFNSSESSLYFDTKSGKFISYGISDMDDLVDTVISMVGKSVYDSAMVEYNKRLPQQYPLPGMTGTSRQVNWAVDIRNKIIEKINAAEMDVHDIAEKAAIKDIKKETRASWWIENRESEIKDMIAAKVEYTENTLPELVGEDDKKKRAAEIRERMRNSIMDRIKKLNIVDNTMLDDFVHKKAYYYLRETGADEWINREKNNHVDIEQILGIAKNPQRRRF
jgi:post-segregation antitoxin (ccd killing protein)